MRKTIDFELKDFATTPNALRIIPNQNIPKTEISVELSRLYHHYYLDVWEVRPPNPDHTNFEYLRYLSQTDDFRFLHQRVNVSTAHKRNLSFNMGQAFLRYFLYEYCGITYFAHMDKILGKPTHPAFEGMKIERVSKGDVPDYLCAKSITKPYIAEAKGRFSNISFNSQNFRNWENQFRRIRIVDRNNIPKQLKGFIVATKFVTDRNMGNNKSKLLAQDPSTIGKELLSEDDIGIGRGCIAIHYANILSKLGLKLISLSLEEGFTVPNDLHFNLPVWKCNYPPLEGKTFIGGYFSDIDPVIQKNSDGKISFHSNILKLGIPSPSFFGLNTEIFKTLRKVSLGNWELLSSMKELPDTEFRPSNIAWLRDGSISGSLDFFELVGFETF